MAAPTPEIRFITADEIPTFTRAIAEGFGQDQTRPDDELIERFTEQFPLETTIGAFDRARMVATFSSYDLELTVPGGGVVPTAGTTVVTVFPTHRRRGILSQMMQLHLGQALERGQAMAALWASDERIYGRFGYGQAAGNLDLTMAAGAVSPPPGPDDITIHAVTVDQAQDQLPPIFDKVIGTLPGSFARWPGWWNQRHWYDPEARRPAGATSRRYVVAEREGEGVGYAIYRQRQRWTSEAADGDVELVELVAVDDDARRSLWHYLANVDLFPNVHHWNCPVDEPLLVETARFRSLVTRWSDSLWIRLLDVPAALEGRRYERDGSLILEVTDDYFDRGGRFSLDVEGGIATCKPGAETEPDLSLDIATLGALYLGGRSAPTMARVGQIAGSAGAVAAVDDIFRTASAPYCIEVF